MVICVVCDVLGAENNGTTIAAMNLIRSLRKRGHTVRVVCPDEERRGEPDFFVVRKLNVGPLNTYVEKNGVVIAKADRAILEQALDGVDAVHIMLPFILGIQTLKLAKEKGLPVTAGFHCQAENLTSHLFLKNNPSANHLVYREFYHLFYQYVDAVHFPTEFIHQVFTEQGGKTNAYVISNGVHSQFRPQHAAVPEELARKKVILFIGRFSKEKSHHLLIEAAALSHHEPELQLVFAGKGPLQEKLEAESGRLTNPPLFRFYDRDSLLQVINSADLYVHPAEIEIEAISCLEAISCGLVPVINNSPRSATRFFALDEKNLFACNDPKDLAETIDYWLDHPDEKAIRSREYLGYTRQFDFETCMDRMENMILETYRRVKGNSLHGEESHIL